MSPSLFTWHHTESIYKRQCAIYMYELAGHRHILVFLMESDLCKTSVMQMRNARRSQIQHMREDTGKSARKTLTVY